MPSHYNTRRTQHALSLLAGRLAALFLDTTHGENPSSSPGYFRRGSDHLSRGTSVRPAYLLRDITPIARCWCHIRTEAICASSFSSLGTPKRASSERNPPGGCVYLHAGHVFTRARSFLSARSRNIDHGSDQADISKTFRRTVPVHSANCGRDHEAVRNCCANVDSHFFLSFPFSFFLYSLISFPFLALLFSSLSLADPRWYHAFSSLPLAGCENSEVQLSPREMPYTLVDTWRMSGKVSFDFVRTVAGRSVCFLRNKSPSIARLA